MPTFLLVFCSVLCNAVRSRHDLLLDNLALRQQLAVISRQQRRPRLQPTDRLFWSWLSRMWSGWQSALALVRPETVVRWQHTAWRHYWTWRSKHLRTPGRDCCHGGSFNAKAAGLGVEAILTPIQAPEANAVAERVVGTLRRECLDHVIVINERQLLRVVREYMVHYNTGRRHRSLELQTPTGPPSRADPPPSGRIVAWSVLGGLNHEYEWVAA